MKKLLLSLVALLALNFAVQAQDYDITTGLRVGFGAAFTIEASAQAFFNDINRLEMDLGYRFPRHYKKNTDDERYMYGGPILTTAFHWHWFLAGGFGLYGGPAIQFGIPHWNSFGLGAGGQVGFDYQFDAPFQIALDFRPIYVFFGNQRGFDPNVGISLRYAF